MSYLNLCTIQRPSLSGNSRLILFCTTTNVQGLKYDGSASDIWSCGVILYALLTGHLPFDDENIRQLLTKVKSGKFYMPTDVSKDAQDLISRMLTVNPKRRITVRRRVAQTIQRVIYVPTETVDVNGTE
jgi:serine/threonine protein kinase